MSTLLERRYRRVVRLLPAGYRQRWEEDMVSAFLESAQSSDPQVVPSRPSWSERLSVIALAIRVRLNGSHTTPRGLVWYHVIRGFALIALLYQSIAATVAVANAVEVVSQYTRLGVGSWTEMLPQFFIWSPLVGLVWVAAFCCLVLGRATATRVLAVLALVGSIGVTVGLYVDLWRVGAGTPELGLSDISRWGWLAVCVAAASVAPPGTRTTRWFWFGAYAAGSAAVIATRLVYRATDLPAALRLANLATLTALALIVAMVVALVAQATGRRPSPQRLLTLAVFAGGFGTARLMLAIVHTQAPYYPTPFEYLVSVMTAIDVISTCLAVICAVVGLLALRRHTGATPSSDALVPDPR